MADTGGPDGAELPFVTSDPLLTFVRDVLKFMNSVGGEMDPIRLHHHVGSLLERHTGPERVSGMTAPEQARGLVYDAMDSEERGPYLALDALSLDPDCADAYVLLGHSLESNPDLAVAMYTLGAISGAGAIGSEAFERDAGNFWGILETRPFMRAVEGLARVAWGVGEADVAAGYYQQLIQLNPNDNQGARYPLMAIALEESDRELAAALFRAYDDPSAMWSYGKALDAFQQEGDSPHSRTALALARAQNPAVPPYLTGAKVFPDEGPRLDARGSEEEAIECADLLLDAWEATEGAIAWLRESERVTAPLKEKRKGPRLAE